MDMAWIRWNLLLSIGFFVSPAFTSTEQSGFRRYYVLQPGPSGTDRVHVSSISSRAGSAGQPRTYNVELTASFGGQVRTRRMGNPVKTSVPHRQASQFTQPQQLQLRHTSHPGAHQIKISGVNVCGGQCCQGWSKAPGSQRCTKPHCLPQCQNGGMCLKPQHCVCKPGSSGKACEHKTVPSLNPPVSGNGPTTGQTNGQTNGQAVVPQRPIPQQAAVQGHAPPPGSKGPQMTLSVKQPPHVIRPQPVQQQIRPPISMTVHQVPSQQFVIKPKYYHTHTQVRSPGPPVSRPIPLSVGHTPLQVGNHTGRIKVVFTPTICKVTCSGSKCQNSCEKGNTTTIISENGHATDTLTAPNFRVVVCHLPCMNGGKCSSRDKCQCPPTFTGKFCQVPVPNGSRRQPTQQQGSVSYSQTSQVHSTHTLPLTFGGGQSQGKFPNMVNIHIKHPPEASVQIHQVSQLDANGQKQKGSQSGHYTYHTETSQKGQQTHTVYPNQQTIIHHYPVTSKSQLGRCFQETSGTQCGKALPGLSKQEDCCGTVGTSWGFHKCQKCPKKPSIPLTGSRHVMDCPPGYKRNNSYCQDINECLIQGVCPNGDCLNTMGSYRCMCKPGFIPNPTLTACMPDTPAVREEKGACFRYVSSGKQCLHPVSVQLSKQLCCCSVGKAWGPHCDKCPNPGTAAFKEICPGGMGYTVTGTYRPKQVNRPQPESNGKPKITHQEPLAPPLPLPTPQRPVEALSVTERQLPAVPEVVEKTSPPAPVAILPSSASQGIAPTQLAEVDECSVNPEICGPGLCYNTVEGYTCICDDGHQLDEERTTCVDIDECAQDPLLCSNGRCRNTAGGFLCECQSGFAASEEGTSCIDVDECLTPGACGDDGFCVNTLGSFTCRYCEVGYRMSPAGQCEDVNECLDEGVCPSGMCTNTPGSYECEPCPEGYEGKDGQCVDVDECLDALVCANGKCSNFEGYFVCACNAGYELSPDGKLCTDIDECKDERVCTRGHCQNTEGAFICSCGPGFVVSLTGDQCDDVDECQELEDACGSVGQCVNNMGSYHCSCPKGYQQVNGTSCEDVDECLDDPELCAPHGECLNAEGSFYCVCEQGFAANEDTHTCEDVDECSDGTRCHGGSCLNTRGSYRCQCDRGYRLHADNDTCLDVDECALNSTVCGRHGFCENTAGSFRCLCDRGFQEAPDGHGCVDVNECELLSGVCGEALCDNVEGTFLCLCPEENQEYNQMTAKCSPAPTASSVERKECYYNLNDENLCENVLTTAVTIEECCCTLGAGWGDNCEVHPCPVQGTDQFAQMCPAGKGSVPTGDSVFGVAAAENYKDADECALFNQEICKGGFCLNTVGGYECYCQQGLYYDETKLQCLDIDECQAESTCPGSECVNTLGSYMCFCTPPLVLNSVTMRCEPSPTASPDEWEQTDIYQDICWQNIAEALTCTNPLADKKTTYTECCCLYGYAWGMDCALCPRKDTEDFASMCNMPLREGQRPYGRDSLHPPTHDYPIHEVGPEYDSRPEPPRFLPNYESESESEPPYDAFEGLRADECGILNGCENGRCVRVQEGYTCDCFDGYTLDMSRMACVDVNECSELNNRMSLCKNAKCINTEGSYRCVCLPGFVSSDRPNYCVPAEKEAADTVRE
ncbi:hypothetical protein MATL_G00186090 [Megalops atlanticus]|uniref:Latent-transforming growth factor beta-binding protein 1 n=1 Tax=Megalops atlanticus TaxID=7932 RepID=A0A9D3PKG0_MEGAT|nr:hypothetical protein MATL_G00186090 [Megalops atlanticus]